MKILNYEKELIAYASSFVSFVLSKLDEVKEIILFGSVVRGEATKESDIDLFFNIEYKTKEKEIKEIIEKEKEKFYKSKIAEVWFLRGIKNPINISVGNLDEWKSLKRSIVSEGMVLYGKYKETPENLKGFVIFNIPPIKNIAKRNKIIRNLFGRKEKNYSTNGLVKNLNGKKLNVSSFIVQIEHSKKIVEFLGKEKTNYTFFEFWSDKI